MPFEKLLMFMIERRMKRLVKKLSNADQEFVKKQLAKLNPKTLTLIEKYYAYKGLIHAAENSNYFNKTLPKLIDGINFHNAKSYIDKFPFSTTVELSQDSAQFLAIPREEAKSVHFTYGSTGRKKTIYNSTRDANLINYSYKLGFLMCGINHTDIAQIMYSFGIWGLAENIHKALFDLNIVTISTGNYLSFEEQKEFIEKYNVSVILGTPSFVYNLAQEIELSKESKEHMKAILVGGEGLPEHRRKIIEKRLGGEVFINYGMNELGGGIGTECSEHNGYHIFPNVILEIIDPKTGEKLPDGEFGELVVTTLRREAMPLIRYRTGDITRIITGDCPCGSPLQRLDYLKGRADDRIIIGAAEKYYPIDFDKLLDSVEGLKDYWIEVTVVDERDSMNIFVHSDSHSDELKEKIIEKLYSMDSIKIDIETTKTVNEPIVTFVDELPKGAKRRRLIDKRKIIK